MKEIAISVIEAARHFSKYLNRAHDQNATFVLLKNGRSFARLSPENENVCSGSDLAKALANVTLPATEAKHGIATLQRLARKWFHRNSWVKSFISVFKLFKHKI